MRAGQPRTCPAMRPTCDHTVVASQTHGLKWRERLRSLSCTTSAPRPALCSSPDLLAQPCAIPSCSGTTCRRSRSRTGPSTSPLASWSPVRCPAAVPGSWASGPRPMVLHGAHASRCATPSAGCHRCRPPAFRHLGPAACRCRSTLASSVPPAAPRRHLTSLLRTARMPAGLTMLIAGLVLWRTEGRDALIGLWVCGSLVFIPGAYFTCAARLGAALQRMHPCCAGGAVPCTAQPSATERLSAAGATRALPAPVPAAAASRTCATRGAAATAGATSQTCLTCRIRRYGRRQQHPAGQQRSWPSGRTTLRAL